MLHDAFIDDLVTPRNQDSLRVASATASAGRRIVGYVGTDIPVELIVAANALPVRLRGNASMATPLADQYLESAFLPETRAIAQQWLNGELDFIDAVVFPRSSDSSQRLYYYLCELQRRKYCSGPVPLLYDLATIARNTSLDHTVNSTLQLATALGVATTELPRALTRVAQRSALLGRMQTLRTQTTPLAGSIAFRVARASECDWSDSFDLALAAWLDKPPTRAAGARILLAGSVPPDERLHLAVEAANGSIVADLFETQHSPSQAPHRDATVTLAQRHHLAISPAQQMLRSSRWLASQAEKTRAQGVIVWLIEEDEALPWELAAQISALREANIPVLALTRERWLATDALSKITNFVGSLTATP